MNARALGNTLTISPIPAKSLASISFNQPIDDATITITNLNGKTLLEQSLKGNRSNYALNTQSLSNGMYVVTVKTNTKTYTKKLFINK